MNKQIIIINGSGGCGKDYFIKLFSKYVKTSNYSSVDQVKEIATIIGWTGEKTEKDRKFLSDLKLLTTDYNDMPFNDLTDLVNDFNKRLLEGNILFLHIREPNEIERAKNEFNAKTLLIKRDSIPQIKSNMADANVDKYVYDYTIENNGTENELEIKALEFAKELFNI